MTTLYRKYRPQVFSDLTGQEHIVQTIMNEVVIGKVAHAYLFSGPRGVGKTTLARLLAKAVNCPNRKRDASEPCGTCSSCQEIATGRNIDVIEIDAASHTGVDNVRENIIENAQFKPTASPFKVFIIDEVHMLSTSAFNALLKTLEEPPAHVIFILATTELHKLPATIISRCQRFSFKKIPYELMLDRLKKICSEEKIKVAKEVLERIIAKSDGCLRDAESLLGQIFSLGGKEITATDAELVLPTPSYETVLNFLENIANKKTKEALGNIANLPEQGINLDQFAYDVIEMLRTIMILQSTNETSIAQAIYGDEILKRIKKISTIVPPNIITYFIDRAIIRRTEIKIAPIPQLPLELFAVECASVSGKETTQDNSEKKIENIVTGTTQTTTATTSTNGFAATIKNAFSHLTSHETPITTTLQQIRDKWKEVVTKLSIANASLTFAITSCTVSSLNHNTIELTTPFSIHKDKLEEKKNRQIIEDTLQIIFGEKIHCSFVIASEIQTINDTELNGLALEFGGEVVS